MWICTGPEQQYFSAVKILILITQLCSAYQSFISLEAKPTLLTCSTKAIMNMFMVKQWCMWQFWVEIKHYSVARFDFITTFEVL